MPDRHAVPRIDAQGHARLALEWLLFTAGFVLLGYVAVAMLDARFAQDRARAALAAAAARHVPSASSMSRPIVLAPGAPIGELSIPRVHLDAVVLHGSDARTLRRGPGHLEDTALPGQPGNVAIAGHRDTFFRQVRDVREGDDVFIDTPDGRYRYSVTSFGVVDPHDTSVLDATAAPMLTLITCYPFWVAGPAPDRFVVRAIEVGRPAGVEDRPLSPAQDTFSDPVELTMHSPEIRAADQRHLPPPATIVDAIERFRTSYNARAATHGPRGAPLALGSCLVTSGAADTTARCPDVSAAATTSEWIFRLQYDAHAWRIVSVEPK